MAADAVEAKRRRTRMIITACVLVDVLVVAAIVAFILT
jgi:hypothetical protein